MSGTKFGRQAAAALCAVGLLAGACSNDQPDPGPPIDGLSAGGGGELSADERRFLFLTEQELVSRCMAEQGFRYEVIPPLAEDFEDSAPAPPPDLDERRRIGYGLSRALGPATGGSAHSDDAPPQDANAEHIATLPPQRQREYGVALFGHDDRQVEMELPDGTTLATNEDGCVSEARVALYGDLATYMYLDHLVNNLRSEAGNRMVADERYEAAHEDWRSCMGARGFDYESPGDAQAAVAEMYTAAGADRRSVLEQEIQVAVADGECDLETGLTDTVDRLRQAYLADVEEDRFGDILAHQELQQEALDRAEDLLEEDD